CRQRCCQYRGRAPRRTSRWALAALPAAPRRVIHQPELVTVAPHPAADHSAVPVGTAAPAAVALAAVVLVEPAAPVADYFVGIAVLAVVRFVAAVLAGTAAPAGFAVPAAGYFAGVAPPDCPVGQLAVHSALAGSSAGRLAAV